VLYSKLAIRCAQAVLVIAVGVDCAVDLLFRPASGDPDAASQWRATGTAGMAKADADLAESLIAS
jgi:hypothetical protein